MRRSTMPDIGSRKTVSIPQACELARVTRRTIYNWMAQSKIQYVRSAGGRVRIFTDTLWTDPEPVVVPESVASAGQPIN